MPPLCTLRPRTLALALVFTGLYAASLPGAQAQKMRLPGTSGAPSAPRLAPTAAPTATTAPTPTAAPAATAPAAPLQADYIVAIVNSEPLTNHDVQLRLARAQRSLASQGQALPAHGELVQEILERLILEKILLQQAREQGMRIDDYAVDQAEQNIARQNEMSPEQMRQRLRAEGIDPQAFREDLRQQLLLQRLRDRELESRVRITDADIEQYLQEQRQAQGGAGQGASFALHLGHILVRVPEDASPGVTDAAQARAQEALEKARQPGADFAAIARAFSDAPEAQNGGDLGLRSSDRYPELFIEAIGGAGTGALVGPVRSPAGWHVLKIVERSSPGMGATVVQTHARHILLRTNAQLSEKAAIARLSDYRRRVLEHHQRFESLAKEYSQDGSADQGGDLGWATPGRYVPEFEQALAALQPGQISAPVVTRFGVHLIELVERREVPITARERREMAREALREKKFEEAYALWAQEQRARAYVEYREPPQ